MLFLLAAPRFWAYSVALPQDGRYWSMGEGAVLSTGELAVLARAYRVATHRHASSPELRNRLGVVEVALGLRLLDDALVREGRDQLVVAAALAPLRTDSWSRLAHAEFSTNGVNSLVLEALRLSWMTGRLEIPDAMRRLQVYLRGWEDLPPEARDDARAQATLLWRGRHLRGLAELYIALLPDERERLRHLLPDPDADGARIAGLATQLSNSGR
ncbi:hypothetical protein [Parvibaculum sp.]|uniref:hypothetical protein n=1 Tax=Parvibaculum sp. TaxID=2024848 RepID=UPI0034A0AB45